jgi:hypothetical protein
MFNLSLQFRDFIEKLPGQIFLCCLMVAAFLVCHFPVHAQVNELKTQGTALEKSVVAVQSGSKTYEQKVSFQEPALIRYTYDEIDQKGNRVNYVYEFNLADLDPYAVREQTQKDLISVVMAVRSKQKLIKVYKNDAVQPYDGEASIVAKNIENARAISDIVRKAIPLAEKVMAARLKLASYDAMISWLTTNVKDVSLGEKSVKQTLQKGELTGTMNYKRVEADSKSSTEEVYTFNLADINANTIAYKITGNQFAINFEALQKAKYFGARKNGEVRPYVNELTISTNNADEARDLKNVLSAAVPLALEKVKAAMPQVSTEKDGVQKIAALTTDITYGDKQTLQSLESGCLTTLTQTEKDPKGGTKSVLKFNWMDVNPLASKIEVAGEKLFIDLKFSDDKKLVMHTADDKFKGYENNVKLYMPDIESARKVKSIIDKTADKCKTSFREPFGNDAATTVAYFRNNIREISLDEMTLKQSVEPVEGDKNKFKYTLTEVSTKGSGGEQVFEFSLSDINPGSVAVDVKGKWLYVVMETDFRAKIIKAYKDGKIQPYTSTLQFAVNDVDLARNLVSALNRAIKAAKPK